MNPFKRAQKKLRSIQDLDPTKLFLESIGTEEEQLIIRLNTEGEPTSQLFKEGINAEGETLESVGGGYSDFTIEEKKSKGQPTDRITLKDTGDFYKSWKITKTNTGLLISINPIKDDTNLLEEWGEMRGLTKENKAILNEQILPTIRKIILAEFKAA